MKPWLLMSTLSTDTSTLLFDLFSFFTLSLTILYLPSIPNTFPFICSPPLIFPFSFLLPFMHLLSMHSLPSSLSSLVFHSLLLSLFLSSYFLFISSLHSLSSSLFVFYLSKDIITIIKKAFCTYYVLITLVDSTWGKRQAKYNILYFFVSQFLIPNTIIILFILKWIILVLWLLNFVSVVNFKDCKMIKVQKSQWNMSSQTVRVFLPIARLASVYIKETKKLLELNLKYFWGRHHNVSNLCLLL